jgi:hypothetical protein
MTLAGALRNHRIIWPLAHHFSERQDPHSLVQGVSHGHGDLSLDLPQAANLHLFWDQPARNFPRQVHCCIAAGFTCTKSMRARVRVFQSLNTFLSSGLVLYTKLFESAPGSHKACLHLEPFQAPLASCNTLSTSAGPFLYLRALQASCLLLALHRPPGRPSFQSLLCLNSCRNHLWCLAWPRARLCLLLSHPCLLSGAAPSRCRRYSMALRHARPHQSPCVDMSHIHGCPCSNTMVFQHA